MMVWNALQVQTSVNDGLECFRVLQSPAPPYNAVAPHPLLPRLLSNDGGIYFSCTSYIVLLFSGGKKKIMARGSNLTLSKKGCAERIAPIGTLSQNGYGAYRCSLIRGLKFWWHGNLH
jgi:hypothetical protein